MQRYARANGQDEDKTDSFQRTKSRRPTIPPIGHLLFVICIIKIQYAIVPIQRAPIPKPTIGPKHNFSTIQPILPNNIPPIQSTTTTIALQQYSPWPNAEVPMPSLRFFGRHNSSSLVWSGVLVGPSAVLPFLESAAAAAGGFGGCILLVVAGPEANAAAVAVPVAAAVSGSSSAISAAATSGEIAIARTAPLLLLVTALPMAEFLLAEECRKREDPRGQDQWWPVGGGASDAEGAGHSSEGDDVAGRAAVVVDGGRGLLIMLYWPLSYRWGAVS